VQPAPEGQPAPEEQLISEKTDSSVAEEKQKTPENTDNRHKICSGEKSALYNTERENGKTGIRLESEYFDIANNFYASNKEKLKKYQKTKEAATKKKHYIPRLCRIDKNKHMWYNIYYELALSEVG
jgi:hypothetical protein